MISLPRSSLHRLVAMSRFERLLSTNRREIERIAERAGAFYDCFDQRKAHSAGAWRHIDNPQGELKRLQSRIHNNILSTVSVPAFICGGVKGRSIKDNARPHVGQRCVLALDLRKCFPRISDTTIFGVYKTIFGCSDQIAKLLLKLTTLHHHLPHGAPTSTALANLALLPLHLELRDVGVRLGFSAYSPWVDNLTFSGNGSPSALEEITSVIHRAGYSVHDVCVMPAYATQRVTGVTLNRKLSAGRSRIRATRNRILMLAAQPTVSNRDLLSIRGHIQQIRQLNSSQAAALLRFADSRLPAEGVDRVAADKFERRPCRGFRTQPH